MTRLRKVQDCGSAGYVEHEGGIKFECDADRDCNSLRTRGAARGRIELGTDVRGEGRDVSRKSRLTLYIVLDYPTYFIYSRTRAGQFVRHRIYGHCFPKSISARSGGRVSRV